MGFFIFCLIFSFLLILFCFVTRKYTNPYKLIMIFGKKGSGKTTTLTKMALQHIKKGWTVYSTELIPGTYYVNYNDIGRVELEDVNYVPFDYSKASLFAKLKQKINPVAPKVLLLVDEVGMIWDNRNFKNFRTDVRDFFKLQRHYHVKCILFSQSFDIDKKLRDLTDSMYLQKNLFRVWTYGKKIRKTITINNNREDGGSLEECFEFEPFIFFFLGTRTITFIPKYSKFFNSFDTPKLEKMEYAFTPFKDVSLKDVDDRSQGESSELGLDNERADD